MALNKFENFIEQTGITDKKLYDSLGISIQTWKKRVQQPKYFTVEQLVILSKILRISRPELLDLIIEEIPA